MDCQRLVFHILSQSLYYSTVENRQTFYVMLLWVMTKQLSIFSHSKQPQQVFLSMVNYVKRQPSQPKPKQKHERVFIT